MKNLFLPFVILVCFFGGCVVNPQAEEPCNIAAYMPLKAGGSWSYADRGEIFTMKITSLQSSGDTVFADFIEDTLGIIKGKFMRTSEFVKVNWAGLIGLVNECDYCQVPNDKMITVLSCGAESWQEKDSVIEKIGQQVSNDKLIEIYSQHQYDAQFEKKGKDKFMFNDKQYDAENVQVILNQKEVLLSSDVTFSDGSKERNVFSDTLNLRFAKDIGIVRLLGRGTLTKVE